MQYYPDYVAPLEPAHPELARQIASFTGVEDVLQWMQRQGLARTNIDIVGQDEFHYDFLIELQPAGQWLSFGVT